ncbi:peamaclein-like isoform X1 [Hibiscus syriacus]|uniref:peamaclein-like isoform X1 n=1 Tax=Hibiscus syriacus TaxID=106335 RepID=UPI0019214405|nr:peamaclein-like isoform X1 [Hibiscus syriacus]
MATTKATLVLAVLCLFLLSEIGMFMVDAQVQRPDCQPKCASRCSKSWKPKMCLKTCTACCNTCQGCVPVGPTANKEVCPCYAKYKKGRCP